MQKQQRSIWYKVYTWTKALNKSIMINNFDNKKALKLAIQNSFIVHFSLTIFGLFYTLGIVINQADFSSVGSNNVNTSKTNDEENNGAVAERTDNRKNTIAIKFNIKNKRPREPKKCVDSIIKNEGARKLNRNAKVGLEVQPKGDAKIGSKVQSITAAMVLVFYWFTTTTTVQPITAEIILVSYWLATATCTLASLVAFSIYC